MEKIVSSITQRYMLASIIISLSASLFAAELPETKNGNAVTIIDTHAHIIRGYRRNTVLTAAPVLRVMDNYKVETVILLPPPFPPNQPGVYGLREIEPVARANPGHFGFAAGGESLNPTIQGIAPDKVTSDLIAEFQQEAEVIVKAGAAGFGEIAAEHFSSGRGNHPYESARPDHPLLIALADIAALHGMPIDVHMEAVPQDMPFPGRRSGRGRNPETLKENISGLERLLEHNRKARIVWAHAGWDLTGERTVPLMRSLLDKHPNLYMSIKLDESGSRRTFPFDPDGGLKPGWLAMLRDFPDRFVIGSDQFFDEGTGRITLVRKFVDALPPGLALIVASENARRIYRLETKIR